MSEEKVEKIFDLIHDCEFYREKMKEHVFRDEEQYELCGIHCGLDSTLEQVIDILKEMTKDKLVEEAEKYLACCHSWKKEEN